MCTQNKFRPDQPLFSIPRYTGHTPEKELLRVRKLIPMLRDGGFHQKSGVWTGEQRVIFAKICYSKL